MTVAPSRFHSFAEFWPFYLGEHQKYATRQVHVVGTLLAVALLVAALVSGHWLLLLAVPAIGYGFAWVKSRPHREEPACDLYLSRLVALRRFADAVALAHRASCERSRALPIDPLSQSRPPSASILPWVPALLPLSLKSAGKGRLLLL